MDKSQGGISRAAASWTLIGVGALGALSLTSFAYTAVMKSQSEDTVAYAADLPLPMNSPKGTAATTTTYAPSFAPQIHTRSRGS